MNTCAHDTVLSPRPRSARTTHTRSRGGRPCDGGWGRGCLESHVLYTAVRLPTLATPTVDAVGVACAVRVCIGPITARNKPSHGLLPKMMRCRRCRRLGVRPRRRRPRTYHPNISILGAQHIYLKQELIPGTYERASGMKQVLARSWGLDTWLQDSDRRSGPWRLARAW